MLRIRCTSSKCYVKRQDYIMEGFKWKVSEISPINSNLQMIQTYMNGDTEL